MTGMIKSLLITLSMYTSIPMPTVKWEEKNLRYCLAFLPAAGLILAALQYLLLAVSRLLGLSEVLYAALFCALTVLVTGGIHIDGLIDTSDALGSHGTREKKQQILSDPHAGAFGIAGVILYFILLFGITAQMYESGALSDRKNAAAVFCAFLISRAFTAIFVVNMEPSKKSGLLYTFSSAAAVRNVTVASAAVLILCAVFLFLCMGIFAVIPAAGAVFCAAYFVRMTKKHFGGLSGDLCGWLIHVSELVLFFCFFAAYEAAGM